MNQPLFFILATVVCLATAYFIAAPLWRGRVGFAPASSDAALPESHDLLLERRDALLRELKDLEFDYKTGKIDDEDYAQMRTATAEAASAVLQRIESSRKPATAQRATKRKKSSSLVPASQPDRSLRLVEIEAEAEILIARVRRRDVALPVNGVTPDAKADDAAGWRCPACDRVMSAGDRFCASCGAARP
ncbi:MAG: zinc ribbon domain-containing protein [Armatimonadota bacterium]|nr:zinc ribbon domain-containing protein [Armatimonadota bacterium]